jgi:hypothetical protein
LKGRWLALAREWNEPETEPPKPKDLPASCRSRLAFGPCRKTGANAPPVTMSISPKSAIRSNIMSTTVNPSVTKRSPGSFEGNGNQTREKNVFASNTVLPGAGQKPAARFFSWPDWRFDRPCYVPSPLNEF